MESKKTLSELMKEDDIFFQVEIKIGPFKLIKKIGTGKFSIVYLGIHEETGQKVAIKEIKKSELNTDILLTKEINIQKKLFHPYITQLFCVIEKAENIFLISEYCSKGDIITNLLDKGNFEEEYSCKVFQQILSSLEYLHKNNICHRDIKPENILLTEKLDAKLTDFGLSRYFKKNELLNTSCGSPIYAAPEMLEGKEYDGTKIDIWGLGINLYTMVCGELPFYVEDENDINTLINNITKGYYSIPDYLSTECKDLIKKILEINPEKRITLEEIKKHKWVNMFNFNFMKSPGVILDEYFLPVDIFLVKDICGNNENNIRILIEDILENKHNENTINYYLKKEIRIHKGEKSIGDLRADSELFLEYINNEKSKKSFWGNDIKKVENYYLKQILDLFNDQKKEEHNKQIINNKLTKKKNLEILNLYIGPLIFIHDIIDDIISKVIFLKNKNNNYLVSSTSKLEIKNKINKQSNIKISKENNIDIKGNINNKANLVVNKINDIELISNSDKKISLSCKKDNNIIKSIDINSKRILALKNNEKMPKRKNKSITNIKHLQINLIENEIIINDLNLKDKLVNEFGLTQNFSQNYTFDADKNCFIKEDSNNQTSKHKRKDKDNKSIDISSKKVIIGNYIQKNIEERPNKHNIVLSNYKRLKNKNKNINSFIKKINNEKKNNFSSLFSFNSSKPKDEKEIRRNFLNNNISYTRIDNKQRNNYFPLDLSKTNKKMQLNEYNAVSYKKINNKKDPNNEKLMSLISPKANKNEIFKINVFDKKRSKNKKEENGLIKTRLSVEQVRQVIKKFVGNNVVENHDKKKLKFVCKLKIGKDDLNFYLELIDTNFDKNIFKGTLIQGETRLYKELLLKIKEKLS